MKSKKILAVIIGAACALILVIALLVSLLGSEKNPNQNTGGDTPASQQDEPQTPVPDPKPEPEPEPAPEPDPEPEPKPEPEPEPAPEPNPEPEPAPEPSPEPEPQPEQTASTGQTLNPNPATKEEIEAVLQDPFMILVNRERKVSSSYVGSDLVYFNDYQLNSTCASALRKMFNAGSAACYSYVLYSGYRSYSSQYNKYYNKISYYESQGKSHEEAVRLTDEYYAPPGGSEHHTGLAADVCIPSVVNKYGMLHENYDQTAEFKWFSTHAHEYGFILRYPNGKESITGYNYEPWHYRYVGVEIATEIYKRNITLEEYIEDLEARLKALN